MGEEVVAEFLVEDGGVELGDVGEVLHDVECEGGVLGERVEVVFEVVSGDLHCLAEVLDDWIGRGRRRRLVRRGSARLKLNRSEQVINNV